MCLPRCLGCGGDGQEVPIAWKIPAWLSFFFCWVINHGPSYFYSKMRVAWTVPAAIGGEMRFCFRGGTSAFGEASVQGVPLYR